MSITVALPDDIAEAIDELSKKSGEAADQVILTVLRAYFSPLPEDLKREFDALERASDEDFLRFERALA